MKSKALLIRTALQWPQLAHAHSIKVERAWGASAIPATTHIVTGILVHAHRLLVLPSFKKNTLIPLTWSAGGLRDSCQMHKLQKVVTQEVVTRLEKYSRPWWMGFTVRVTLGSQRDNIYLPLNYGKPKVIYDKSRDFIQNISKDPRHYMQKEI